MFRGFGSCLSCISGISVSLMQGGGHFHPDIPASLAPAFPGRGRQGRGTRGAWNGGHGRQGVEHSDIEHGDISHGTHRE